MLLGCLSYIPVAVLVIYFAYLSKKKKGQLALLYQLSGHRVQQL